MYIWISLIIAFIVPIAFILWNQFILWWRFNELSGDYLGYSLNKNNWKVGEHPESRASIKYRWGNILKIGVEHESPKLGHLNWRGTIVISREFGDRGHIVWEYMVSSKDHRKFGFKRCIINKEKREIYLIGEENYGKEIFIKV